MLSNLKTLLLTVILSLLSTSTILAQALPEGAVPSEEAVSSSAWIAVVVLIMLVIVGFILAKVRANKNKQEVRQLMEEMKEE